MKKILIYILLAGFTFLSCSKSANEEDQKTDIATLRTTITIKDLNNWETDTEIFIVAYNTGKQKEAIYKKKLEKPLSNTLNIECTDISIGPYTNIQIEVTKDGTTKIMQYYGNTFIKSGNNILDNKNMNLDGPAPNFYFSKIQDGIFNSSCIQCHSNILKEAELDLSNDQAYNSLVNINSNKNSNIKLVIPKDMENSFLYVVLKDKGNLKQLHATKVNLEQLKLIEDWIKEGAKEE